MLTSTSAATQLELRLTQVTWDNALRAQLLVTPSAQYAVGNFRTLPGSQNCKRMLVDRLEVMAVLPTGDQRPPLDDWVVLHVLRDGKGSAEELLQRLVPARSQSLALLVLHQESDQWSWAGLLRERSGAVRQIDQVHVIGPDQIQLDWLQPEPAEMSPIELDRYSRQIGAIGLEAMQRLRQATITIVGVGGNGSLLAEQLVTAGVGHLRLMDDDTLESSNLSRMPLVHMADIGQPKVRAVGRRLMALRPDLHIACLETSVLSRDGSEALRQLGSTMLVTCVDRDEARLAASLLARETLTPHLDIGTAVTRVDGNGRQIISGDVRLLLPRHGCTLCVGGYADDEQTLYDLAAPPGAMRRGIFQSWDQTRGGSLISINAIAVGAAVQMLLDYLGGRLLTSFWQRISWSPIDGLTTNAAPVGAGKGCGICGA